MPKRSKRNRHCLTAAKKRWNDTKSKHEKEVSDADESSDEEQTFDAILMDRPFDDDQFVKDLEGMQPNVLEELVKNARQSNPWITKGRKQFYTGFAKSTLRNKKAAWRKAASGSNKITNWFPKTVDSDELPFEMVNSSDEDELPFKMVNSSDEDDNMFTLASLDALLRKKSDVRLNIVSQFLHLVQDQGLSKLSASNLLAGSVNRVHGMRGLFVRGPINGRAKVKFSPHVVAVTQKLGRH